MSSNPRTDELFSAYQHLVDKSLNRYRGKFKGPDLDDITSDANYGLLLAIQRFDPTRSVKFETYAYIKIQKAIQEGFRDRDFLSRRARQKDVLDSAVSLETIDKGAEPSLQYIEKGFEQIDNQDLIAVMLAGLDEKSRDLIQMRFLKGMDVQAISQATGIHKRTVYRKIDKIIKQLSRDFKDE